MAATDIANSLREVFSDQDNVDIKLAESPGHPTTRTVTSTDGGEYSGDALVWPRLGGNFFGTPGADEPLPCTRWTTPRACARASGLFEQWTDDPR